LEGQWEECAEILGEMTRLDDRHEDSLYYRGNCFLEMGLYESAKECWDQLVRVNPASSRAWTQLGTLRSLPEAGKLFDLDEAVAALREAHRINRESSGPLILLGKAELARGDLLAAEEMLRAAYGMNHRATAAFYLSAYLAWKKGDATRARELLDRASQSVVEEKPIHGVLGEGDTRSSEMEKSRRRARRRELFARCTEALQDASTADELDQTLACVDEVRASLPSLTEISQQ
jgi:tetratricopeptide (TPR) repeat protein